MMGSIVAKSKRKADNDMIAYVVATDQSCSVREFVIEVYTQLGYSDLYWSGTGVDTKLRGSLPLV